MGRLLVRPGQRACQSKPGSNTEPIEPLQLSLVAKLGRERFGVGTETWPAPCGNDATSIKTLQAQRILATDR